MNLLREKNVRLAFQATLIFKAVLACLETLAGFLGYFISPNSLLFIVRSLTEEELFEDPRDVVANYLRHWAQHLSVSEQHFAAFYLLSHGMVKLWLIAGLLRRRLWYYPTAIAVFALFILYQSYRFTLTHSLWLALISVVDVSVIILTWHEFSYLRRANGALLRSPFKANGV